MITVMVSGLSVGVSSAMVCPDCTTQPLAEVIEAAQRGKQAGQFATQAEREVTELTRDPGKCKEWIKDRQVWDGTLHNYVTIDGHYCTRNAFRHGYCKQHLWTNGIDAETGQRRRKA